MSKHLLVVSQYFYPEEFRINDMCAEWVKRGYRVTVLTGIPNYPQGRFYQGYGWFKKRCEVLNDIRIIRLPILPRGSKPIMLALNYLSFVVSGFFWSMFTRTKADAVFVFEVSPMTQALPAVWFAKKRKIPCFLYVQDLWPENVEIITGIKNKHIIGAIGKMVDYIYARCTRIFTASQSFAQAIALRGVPPKKITYWPQYAEEFYKPTMGDTTEIPADGAFNIVFAGNIGTAQGLDILPKAAAILEQQHPDIKVRFHIIGDGRNKKELIGLVLKKYMQNMFNFIPQQPAESIPSLLCACDAAFLSFTDSPLFAMTIPAKLQTYMACGMPIIVCAAGESARIINESQSGNCTPPRDAQALVQSIVTMAALPPEKLQAMGENALEYSQKHFSKQLLMDQMDVYFNQSAPKGV